MDKPPRIDDLLSRLSAVFQSTPAADLQRNLRAVLEQGIQRLDLVSREELENQQRWVASMRERIEALEARLAQLEAVQKRD